MGSVVSSVVGSVTRLFEQPCTSACSLRGEPWRVAGLSLDFKLVALVEPPVSVGFSSSSPII